MKNSLLIVLVFIVLPISIFAQSPDTFNYQAVIRDNSNQLLTNQDVGIKVSILDGSSSGSVLYSETHSETTNDYGIINLNVGDGNNPSADFAFINWSSGKKFLKIEMDESGGSSYTYIGTVQLLSVPYALYANSASNLGDENIYSPITDTLFVVKDHDGNVVFAVFPDGAAVYVNEFAKGKVGGFAVSGRSPSKASEEEYLVVTADSTRVYVNEATEIKGKVGGFAVSGRSPSKGTVSSLMDLTKENYFIGHEAGVNNTTGLYNSFFGYEAGFSNLDGSKNIFIGYKSGLSNENGFKNVFVGDSAGFANISGSKSVMIGDNSGKSNTTGYSNVFIGDQSGKFNEDGVSNVFIGNVAGKNNISGSRNVFCGFVAGVGNTYGEENIFLGAYAGRLNTSGSNNIFLGSNSGYSNAADNNIFIGNKSGFTNNTGTRNVFLGYQSGFTNESGFNNVFLGNNAGFSNTNGFKNVFIGDSAGYLNNEGRFNIFIGDKVGFANSDGTANVIIGATAGQNNSTGKSNTFVGNWSGNKNEIGNQNVFLGDRSGWNNISGSRNVYIGYFSGYNNTEGWNNVFIGNYAGKSMKGSNKFVISNWDADSTQALIYGEFDKNILFLNGKLDGIKFLNSSNVDSNYISEGNYLTFGHHMVSEDFMGYKNNTFYFLDAPGGGDVLDPNVVIGGKVGIGVLVPAEKLDVDGNINVTGGYLVNGAKGNFADYVFENDYKLESIEEHADFMWNNKHLPALKSANEIKNEDSYDISERREQMLEELEKAHIYIEQLNDEIKELKESNELLIQRLEKIEKSINN